MEKSILDPCPNRDQSRNLTCMSMTDKSIIPQYLAQIRQQLLEISCWESHRHTNITSAKSLAEVNKKDGYCQLNVRQLCSLRPWEHRGKCYMDRKRIQCLSNASQHVHTYFQPFTSYSEILVINRNFFLPTLHLTPPYGVAPGTIAVKCHTVGKRIQCL